MVAASMCAFAAPATADFETPVNFAVGTGPADLEAADFNGDRLPDVAVANKTSNTVSVLLGSPISQFTPAVNYSTGASTGPGSITVLDIQRNGRDDVVTGNQTSGNLSQMFGNGLGALGNAVTLTATGGVGAVWSDDINGDPAPDLVYTNPPPAPP